MEYPVYRLQGLEQQETIRRISNCSETHVLRAREFSMHA